MSPESFSFLPPFHFAILRTASVRGAFISIGQLVYHKKGTTGVSLHTFSCTQAHPIFNPYSYCLRRLNTEKMKSRVCIPSMGKMKKFCPATNSLPFTACGANMESGSVNGGTSDPGVACAPSSRFLSALSARRFDGMSGPSGCSGGARRHGTPSQHDVSDAVSFGGSWGRCP